MAVPTRAWCFELPKADVHVHLEGCIPVDLLEAAARAQGVDLPVLDESRGLDGLLEHLDASCRLLVDPGLVAELGSRFARRCTWDGIVTADVIFNPTHWPAWDGRLGEFVDALDRGMSDAEADGHPPVRLLPSVKRDQSAEAALALVDAMVALGHPRVVGLSIDGNEAAAGPTGERFRPAFERAAEAGFHRAVHAGESSGPDGVRDAIDLLMAERVDHGVRAVEDPALVAELAARGIPLDVCPTSNLTLGLYPILHSHPVDELRRAGVRVALGTDDPELLGGDLTHEYHSTAAAFGWDHGTVAEVARTSIEVSFAPDELKAELLAELDAFVARAAVEG
ncbi:adenosine deaminase [Dermatobacter hominis]|uniref:adenosine deaminase n=1 Tax=Dermatobacter hominis TaxID=2884263 RepID=UPI001D10D22D|nr:adenosine deaminase [Dermatobacter hominis]UDY37738.1 adenosine deaminase [Dermatobacter hominis]